MYSWCIASLVSSATTDGSPAISSRYFIEVFLSSWCHTDERRVPRSTLLRKIFSGCSEERAGELAGARAFGSVGAELCGEEVGDSRVGQAGDAGGDGLLVAHERHVGRTVGAFAVEHRPVARQLPVDGEDLGPAFLGRVGVVGDAHGQTGDD